MNPFIHIAPQKLTSKKFGHAFFTGCPGSSMVQEYTPGPWAGLGAPCLMNDLKENIKSGHNFWYADNAYFGRGKYYRVTKNAFQHNGVGIPDFKRLRPFWEKPKPWNKDGSHILLCTQTQAYYDRFGISDWEEKTINQLKLYTDRPIIVRRKGENRGLLEDLQNTWMVVCHTSNVAVESIMEGVPAIATGQCAASIMALSDPALVEFPFYPDDDQRMKWAGVLAANQWTLDEISQGLCWEKVK